MIDTSPTALAQHARDLATAFRIELRLDPARKPHEASALTVREKSSVLCHPIVDESTYAVVLHELGHLLGPGGQVPVAEKLRAPSVVAFHRLTLHEEECAWAWAHHNALLWTPLMTSVEEFALNNYREGIAEAERTDATMRMLGMDSPKLVKSFLTFLMKMRILEVGHRP